MWIFSQSCERSWENDLRDRWLLYRAHSHSSPTNEGFIQILPTCTVACLSAAVRIDGEITCDVGSPVASSSCRRIRLDSNWKCSGCTRDIQGRRSVCSKRILRGFQTHKEEKCVYRLSRLPSSHKHPPSSLTACRWWNSGSFSTPPHAENRFRQTVSSQLAIFPAPIGRHLAPEIKKHQQESLDVCCEALLRQQAVWEEVSRGRLPRRRLSQVTDGEVWSQWARSARRVILRRRWYRTWFIRTLFYNVTHIFKQPSNLASYWLFYSARQWYIANI